MRRNRMYLAAKRESERLLTDAYLAADKQAADTIEAAHAKHLSGEIDHPAKLDVYANASDTRAASYAQAEREHYDRLAAIQRHFSQQVVSRGNPDAPAALDFVATVADPEGLYAPVPAPAPVGELTIVDFNGIRRQVIVDGSGRVIAENPVADDGWSSRQTFTPADPDEFVAAKRAGIAGGGDR